MGTSDDKDLVRAIDDLLAVPDDARSAWLLERYPGDASMCRRLLDAVASDDGAPSEGARGVQFGITSVQPADAVPERFERYQVERLLGQGGMGRVYLAQDPVMRRPVAIKVLSRHADQDYRRRFLREARAAGGLKHPNIVTIYDVGESGERPFIVMEYIEGRSLQQLLVEGPPRGMAARIAVLESVCDAIQSAHAAGILHRDIKPGNVMVDAADLVKVLDFGVAKPLAERSVLTQTPLVVGTVGYMAPEQAAAGEVDARSDVYSIAVLAYEFLTLHRPFDHHESPLPPALDAILRRGMALRPKDRYQTAADLGLAFREFRAMFLDAPDAGARVAVARRPASHGPPAPRAAPKAAPHAPTARLALAAAVGLGLLATGFWYTRNREDPVPPRREVGAAPAPGNAADGRPAQPPVVAPAVAGSGAGEPPPTSPAADVESAPQERVARPGTERADGSARLVAPDRLRNGREMSDECRALLAQIGLGEALTQAQNTAWKECTR